VPPSGSQGLICGTPSSNISTCTWTTPSAGGGGVKAFVTSNFSQLFSSTFTPANLVGLSWSIAASTNYILECRIMFGASVGTAEANYALTGPASPTLVTVSGYGTSATATTVNTYATQSAAAFPTQFGQATGFAAATDWANFTAIIENGVNSGTLQVQAGASGTGTLTINAYEGGCVLN